MSDPNSKTTVMRQAYARLSEIEDALENVVDDLSELPAGVGCKGGDNSQHSTDEALRFVTRAKSTLRKCIDGR